MNNQLDKLTFGTDKLRATVSKRDDALWFEMTDLVNGRTWGEVPLMTLEVHEKYIMREELAHTYHVDVFEEVPGGVHVFVTDTPRSVSLGLWIRIEDDELSVFLQPAEVYERNPQIFRLFTVNMFPGMMRTGPDGALILPLTSGVLCHPADKPALRDRFLIYGEQSRWELTPLMPYTAVDTGSGGLMALATQCPMDAECFVETDGHGNGWTGFGFSFRKWWPDPVDFQSRELRFIPIPPKETAYVFVAKRVRRHVMDDLGKPTLRKRMEESPEVEYLAGAYTMKMFYAIENEFGPIRKTTDPDVVTSPTSFETMMTFAEARIALKKVHDAGIDKVLTQGVGWNCRGHDGMYPTRLPADERLGGQKGFEETLAFGNTLGFHMNVHDNYSDVYRVSPDFDEDIVIWDMFGEPMVWGCWGGGISYNTVGTLLPYERLQGELLRMKTAGVRGHYYLDSIGKSLQTDHHPKHRGPRRQFAEGIVYTLEETRKAFGSVGIEQPHLYSAVPADCVANCGYGWDMKERVPQWPVSQLCDRNLPIWHLIMHDLTLIEGHGEDWKSIMTNVLLGLHPRTEWSTRPGIHPVLDDTFVSVLKAIYDLVIGRFGHLQTLEITDFQEPTDMVKVSTFEDGTEVVADFGKEELFVNGENIPRPDAVLG